MPWCPSTRSSTPWPRTLSGPPHRRRPDHPRGAANLCPAGLELIVDTGQWWLDETGLPLPLGANAIRKDLGPERLRDVDRLLRESIRYALEHREEALAYALEIRPRPSPREGRPVRRHVRQPVDARFRPARPPGGRRTACSGPRRRRDSKGVVPEFIE